MPKQIELAVQQTIIPDYRMGVFDLLRDRLGDGFMVFAGEHDFGGSPISSDAAWGRYTKVSNHYCLGSRLLWQSGMIRSLLEAKVVILNGNLRILSNYPVLFMRRVLGRRTLLWSHADGRSRMGRLLRRLYCHLSNGIVAYTESDKEVFCVQCPSIPVWVAPNSCVYAGDCLPVSLPLNDLPTAFIYVGRLIEEKKVDSLLRAFSVAVKAGSLPDEARLIIVGDGPAKSALSVFAQENSLSDRVCFTGHISNTDRLRELYSQAIASVSPGYVGLSATQSFSFGIPMLISKDEQHSPEIEACQAGFNAMFFKTGDLADFSEALVSTWKLRSDWISRRSEIASWTRENYSFEAMVEAFISSLNGELK